MTGDNFLFWPFFANELSSLSRRSYPEDRRLIVVAAKETQVNRTPLGIPSSSVSEEFPARFPQECGSSLTKTRSFSRLMSHLLFTLPLWDFAYREKSHQ